MTKLPKDIFRKSPYNGIINEVAKELNISHTRVSTSFYNAKSKRQLEIKKLILEKMKERKKNFENSLDDEILELIKG